jgi:hypothetical protein
MREEERSETLKALAIVALSIAAALLLGMF